MGDPMFWKDSCAQMVAPDLSPLEKQLLDKFVTEYMHDYDVVNAAVRCGFQKAFAKDYGTQFINEPYVLQQIKERERALIADEKVQAEDDRLLVLSVLRQATKVGPYASRVAAAAKIATILGLDKHSKESTGTTHRGGVMAVPGIASIDDWEKAAMQSQSQLLVDTRA